MGKEYIPNVWFADEQRIRSISKFFNLSDKGSLRIGQNSLEFQGKKSSVRMAQIREISIANQQISWISLLITNILFGIFLLVLGSQLPTELSLPKYIFALYSILAILGGDAFAVIVGYGTKWIRIEYEGERVAYLADGSFFGWGGVFGGTKKLFRKLKLYIG